MATAIGEPMPEEVGYVIVPVIDRLTRQEGEVWIAGCLDMDFSEIIKQKVK